MTSSETVNDLHWYAIHTHLNQENRVEANLQAWNVKVFYPKIKEKRRNEFSGAITLLTKPFFGRYLFARFKAEQLYKVWFTRGVHSVVSFGGLPSVVDDEVIDFLKTRTTSDGFVRHEEDLMPGDTVIMKSGGVLDELVGIFEREMNNSQRVMILLETIRFQGHVIVEKSALRKVGLSQ